MLDQKRDKARARRKGIGSRFVLQIIWFVISIALSYWVANLILTNGLLTYDVIRSGGVPSTWSNGVIDLVLAAVVFLLLQVLFTFGYILGNPAGRRRTSRASMTTFNPEYYESSDD